MLSETGHPKEDRPLWVNMISQECAKFLERNLPLLGVCMYPVIDRPDWDHTEIWHHSGIWDHDFASKYSRVLHLESAVAIVNGQQLISKSQKNKFARLLMRYF